LKGSGVGYDLNNKADSQKNNQDSNLLVRKLLLHLDYITYYTEQKISGDIQKKQNVHNRNKCFDMWKFARVENNHWEKQISSAVIRKLVLCNNNISH